MALDVLNLDTYPVGPYIYGTTRAWRPNSNGSTATATIVANSGRTGGNGLKIGFTHSSQEASKSYRSELQSYNIPNDGKSREILSESWLSCSYFFESHLSTHKRDIIIGQFHQGLGTPPVYLIVVEGVLYLSHRSYKLAAYNASTELVTETNTSQYREYSFRTRLCKMPVMDWVDIVIQCIPQTMLYPNSSYNGVLKLWVNGTLLVSVANDIVLHNFFGESQEAINPNVKFGHYISEWAVGSGFADGSPANSRYVTLDNIKWGDAGTTLASMMPAGGWAQSVDLSKFVPVTRTTELITAIGSPIALGSQPTKIISVVYPASPVDTTHALVRRA